MPNTVSHTMICKTDFGLLSIPTPIAIIHVETYSGDPGDARREKIFRIPMHVVKGDWNWAVSRNNRKKGGPVSLLGRVR